MVVVGGGERQMQPRRATALDEFRRAVRSCRRHLLALLHRHPHPSGSCMPQSYAVSLAARKGQ